MTVAINSLSQSPSVSTGSLQSPAVMVEMARMLGSLQVDLAKAFAQKAEMEEQMSQAQVDAAQKNYDDVLKRIQEASQQEHHRSFWQTFVKVIEVAVTVVAGVIALSSGIGAFAMFGITTALVAFAESSAMDPIKKGLSQVFQDMGLPKSVADIVVSVVITAAVVAASVACGKACSAGIEMYSAAKTAVQDGVEMSNYAETAAQNASGSAARTAGVSSVKIATVAAAQMVMSENLAQEIVAALPIKGQLAKEITAIIATVIQDILCAFAMAKGANMGNGGAVPGFVAKLPSMSSLVKGEMVLQALSLVPQGITAYTYGKQASILGDLADASSSSELIHGMMSMISADQKSSARFEKGVWGGFQDENARCGGDLFRGDAAFADVLAHRAV